MIPQPRTLLFALSLLALGGLALGACTDKRGTEVPEAQADPDWPEAYATWTRVNGETIVRPDEGVARELYAKAAPDLGVGTVLVKEEHGLVEGAIGGVTRVAVMKRTGGTRIGGWSFLSFDPATRQRVDDEVASCEGCHTLRADADYLFTDRDALAP